MTYINGSNDLHAVFSILQLHYVHAVYSIHMHYAHALKVTLLHSDKYQWQLGMPLDNIIYYLINWKQKLQYAHSVYSIQLQYVHVAYSIELQYAHAI